MAAGTIKPPEGFFIEKEIAPPEGFVIEPEVADAPIETTPLDTDAAFERAGKVWDTSVDLGIPLKSADKNYEMIEGIADPNDISPAWEW
jgi:hypothetical protein